MKLIWFDSAWKDYLYWQDTDKQILKKINQLIRDIQRKPYTGIGKPEPLKFELSGCWSRRITDEHRIVYRVQSDYIEIISCKLHYKN